MEIEDFPSTYDSLPQDHSTELDTKNKKKKKSGGFQSMGKFNL